MMNQMQHKTAKIDFWINQSPWIGLARLERETIESIRKLGNPSWIELKVMMADRPAELVEILTQAIPVRYGLWWGLVCGSMIDDFAEDDQSMACVDACMDWVFDESETTRLACRKVSDPTSWSHAEGLLARAVSWSSGSILPDHIPAFVAAPAGVTGYMISGSIQTFAARGLKSHGYEKLMMHFIHLGEEVVSGKLLPEGWERRTIASGQGGFSGGLEIQSTVNSGHFLN